MHLISDLVVALLSGLVVWSLLAFAAGAPMRKRRRGFRGMRRSRSAATRALVFAGLGLTGASPVRFARRSFALG